MTALRVLVVIAISVLGVVPFTWSAESQDGGIRLLETDTAITVGRPVTIRASVEDRYGRISTVRFVINGQTACSIPRGPSPLQDVLSCEITPRTDGRVGVSVEGLDREGKVAARDLLWLKPAAPFTQSIRVRAPRWGEQIPESSTLHQRPIVSVHPRVSAPEPDADEHFGLNHRPARIVFIVDGEGFGSRTIGLLNTLGSIASPTMGMLRPTDEVGILLTTGPMRVHQDFADGSLQRLVDTVLSASGAGDQIPASQSSDRSSKGSADLAILLGSLLSSARQDRSTVGIIVTNGVRWGNQWVRKPIPGTLETNALITPDDLKLISALSYERDLPIHTLAVSTSEVPIERDARGQLSLQALERLVHDASSTASDEQGEKASQRSAKLSLYMRQMFDLLRTIAATTGAGEKVQLCDEDRESIRKTVAGILASIVGRFQRHDFEVYEEPFGAKCEGGGQRQILDRARARINDKIVLAVVIDRSGSTDVRGLVDQVQVAYEKVFTSLRPHDCLLLYSFSARDLERHGDCIASPDDIAQATSYLKNGPSYGTDIPGSVHEVGRHLVELQASMSGNGQLAQEQKLQTAIVLITDGNQTSDSVDEVQVASYLRTHGIRLFEVMIDGLPCPHVQSVNPPDPNSPRGSLYARPACRHLEGWSAGTGGALLTPQGRPIEVRDVDYDIARLVNSVYRSMRDTYQIEYTSMSPEKEWRDVCIRIKDRPDLYVLREQGDGYRADKSAFAYLFNIVEDSELPLTTRLRAVEGLGEIGTDFELRRVAAIASGKDADLRVPAFLALLRMMTRLDLPIGRLDRIQKEMDTATRLDLVNALISQEDLMPAAVGQVLGNELSRPAAQSSEELLWQTMLALGRIEAPLSDSTLQRLGALSQSPEQSPSIRQAARKLLESAAGLRSSRIEGVKRER